MTVARRFAAVGLLAALAWAQAAPEAAIQYFSHLREVSVHAPATQNFAVLPTDVWQHAQRDLRDLRLYDAAAQQVPYVIVLGREQLRPLVSGGFQTAAGTFSPPLLEPGAYKGEARVVLDMSRIQGEYNEVTLDVRKQDFVAVVKVEGSNALRAAEWTSLGEYTIYDLTREQAGRHVRLALPRVGFAYLRLNASNMDAKDFLGAQVSYLDPTPLRWSDVEREWTQRAEGRDTVLESNTDSRAPIERLLFEVGRGERDFSRAVEVSEEFPEATTRAGRWRLIASGNIHRIQRRIGDRQRELQQFTVEVPREKEGRLRIVVRNGDDAPLGSLRVRGQMLERRIYFDPRGQAALRLFYGDAALGRPQYDYSSIFNAETEAAEASVGPAKVNGLHIARPDTRPWTERNPWLLWVVVIAAVAVLGRIALKSLKPAS